MQKNVVIGFVLAIASVACDGDSKRSEEPPAAPTSSTADDGLETIYSGVARSHAVFELAGSVSGMSDGATLTAVHIPVILAPKADAFDLRPPDALSISYFDETVMERDLAFTLSEVAGDGDGLLESGEMAEIAVSVTCDGCHVSAGQQFTIEVKPGESASYLIINRTVPGSIAPGAVELN